MELSEKQIKRIKKLAKFGEDKDIATIENFIEIDEKIDDVKDYLDNRLGNIQEELKKKLENELVLEIDREELKGEDGYTPVKGVDYFDGKDGKNYILTNIDKKQIAKSITVPVVEKIIEKTEVIKEQPIEIIKEVALKDTGEEVIHKINEDETSFIKKEKIEDFEKTEQGILDRAVSIVDNRTSFLINKVSNLSEKVDKIPTVETQDLQEVTDLGSTTTNTITANAFIGDGSGLTGLPAPDLSGVVPYTGATGNVNLGSNVITAQQFSGRNFGTSNTVTGFSAFAFGNNNIASALLTFALGIGNTATATRSTAMGNSVENAEENSSEFGFTDNKINVSANGLDLKIGGVSVANMDSSGNITGNNLSGTNTGDQDLSGYVPKNDLAVTPKLSIDSNTRKLYANDGTTVMMNYANAWGTSTNPSILFAGAGNETMIGNSNILFGYQAGLALSNGYENFIAGEQAGNTLATGFRNVILGPQAAFNSLSSGNRNVVMGYQAGYGVTTSFTQSVVLGERAGYNMNNITRATLIGWSTGLNTTTSTDLVAIGYGAGSEVSGAQFSGFFGYYAGQYSTGCNDSFFLGSNAGRSSSGSHNTFAAGTNAGRANTGSYASIFLGASSGQNANRSYGSAFIGNFAGYNNNDSIYSVRIGSLTGYSTSAVGNAGLSTMVGYSAGYNATDAYGSTFIGMQSGYLAPNVRYGTFLGFNAGLQATDASGSLFAGNFSGAGADYSIESVFLGLRAGSGASKAAHSIFIGRYAGFNDTVDNAYLLTAPTTASTSENTGVTTTSYETGLDAPTNLVVYEVSGSSSFTPGNYISYNVIPYKDVGGTYYYGSAAYYATYVYGTGSNFSLSWDAVAGADGYAVIASYYGYPYYVALEYTTLTYTTDNGSWYNSPYDVDAPWNTSNYATATVITYRIHAYETVGSTTYYSSNYAARTFNAFTADGSGVDLTWSAVPNADGYKVLRNVNNAGFLDSGDTATNSITDDDTWAGNTTVTPVAIVQTTGATSIAIGNYSGTGGYKNSIALGRGVINSAATQANIGNALVLSGIYNSDTQSSTLQTGSKATVANLNIANIPTSSVGLSSGDVWSDGGTLKIV